MSVLRSIRFPDDLIASFLAEAERRGTTLNALVVEKLSAPAAAPVPPAARALTVGSPGGGPPRVRLEPVPLPKAPVSRAPKAIEPAPRPALSYGPVRPKPGSMLISKTYKGR